MSVTLSLFAGAGAQFFDNNGNPLTGGKIYTYSAGTTTPLATYTTNSNASFHTNPIILDAAGRVPNGGEIWLTTGLGYKFVVKTSTEVLIATYDNIPSSAQPPAANDADSIMYEQGYTVNAGSFVVGKIYRIVSVGTTNFTLIGAASNSIGLHFIATGVGTGNGTAELAQTVEAKLRETVSVKDFGAVGNGVADDTAAIQAAIDSFGRGTGTLTFGTILFPLGTYKISDQLEINQQRISLLGNNAVLQWFGTNTKAMLRIQDSTNVVVDSLFFLGNALTPPTAAIYFEQNSAGTVGTNEFCTVSNVTIGRFASTSPAPGTYPLQRGIWFGGPFNGNNDSFYIERCTIHDCTTAGIAIDNNQSIWGQISNAFINTCGYGIYTGSNVQCTNVGFNRNTVADFYAFRDITVNIDGFNSENAVLPIQTTQGASMYINGGKILCRPQMVGSYWADFAAPNYISLENLQVIQSGVTDKKMRVTGTATITANVYVNQCRLPDAETGAGFEFNFTVASLGGYINVSAPPYENNTFAKYRVAYTPASMPAGTGLTTNSTGATLSDVLVGDIYAPSFKADLQSTFLTGGVTSASTLGARFQNQTSGSVDLDSSFIYWRKIDSSKISASASATYTSPVLANNTQDTTTLSIPTAQPGNFVALASAAGVVNNQLVTTAYVSATGTITVVAFNGTGGNAASTTANLKVALLREDQASYIAAVAYDPPNLASLAQTTTTLSVPGVSIGDTVFAAFSNDLQAITLRGYVSAADTVTVIFFNGTLAPINLGAGLLRVLTYTQGY